MAQQIGQLINVETKTALPQHFDTSRMDELMSRSELTLAECDELRSIALAMPVENIPVETKELAKQLQFIEATLPSKNTDEQSGQMRTAVYARILGGYTKEALSYMTERVCKELDWFPTPRQCLQILDSYTPRTTKKDKALYRRRFLHCALLQVRHITPVYCIGEDSYIVQYYRLDTLHQYIA